MSLPSSTPVSEVIRNMESLISRANEIRRRAEVLFAQADLHQEEAYLALLAELGEEDGVVAYRLACRSVGADPQRRTGAIPGVPATEPTTRPLQIMETLPPVEDPRVLQPVTEAVNTASVPSAVVTAVEPPAVDPSDDEVIYPPIEPPRPRQADPSRIVLFGVSIKRSKHAEAEEVVEQARRSMAQNRKSNPYADDRGRNAWRNTLFAAVLASETSSDVNGSASSAPGSNQVLLDDRSVTTGDSADIDTGSRGIAKEEIASVSSSGEDVLDDGIPPSRSVPLTRNPAQKPAPSVDRVSDVEPDHSAQRFRTPSPFSRPINVPPRVHESVPVHNRPHGFGQSVPLPPGLKDEIARIQSGQQDTPAATVTTPRPLGNPRGRYR